MNLHAVVSPYIRAVNPMTPVTAQIMIGEGAKNADYTRTPKYATPGAFTASIAGTLLTIATVSSGFPQAGQAIAGAGVPANTAVTSVVTQNPDGTGTFNLNRDCGTIGIEAVTATMTLLGQVQPLAYPDLKQIEALNLGGEKRKIYVSGDLNGTVRVKLKGGDLITMPDGQVWLVVQSLEGWSPSAGWTCAALTLQNGS